MPNDGGRSNSVEIEDERAKALFDNLQAQIDATAARGPHVYNSEEVMAFTAKLKRDGFLPNVKLHPVPKRPKLRPGEDYEDWCDRRRMWTLTQELLVELDPGLKLIDTPQTPDRMPGSIVAWVADSMKEDEDAD